MRMEHFVQISQVECKGQKNPYNTVIFPWGRTIYSDYENTEGDMVKLQRFHQLQVIYNL